jgi:2-oxoglutarate ferredoxin oxidoreductase subunit beta
MTVAADRPADTGAMQQVAGPPESLWDRRFTYCPGCTHGIIHRLVAEAIDDLNLRERAVCIASVGCSVFAYEFFRMDAVQAAHGRAPAVATGIKRVRPEAVVFTYQGDGDLASIGMAEIIHAAARGERITIIFANNAVYGMTQGQHAPTTLLGQRTSTTPLGRAADTAGFPIRVCEILATLDGPAYIARVAAISPKHIREAGRAIRKAFRAQTQDLGFAMVEVVGTCPTFWKMTPIEAMRHAEEHMLRQFPLGEFVEPDGGL